MKNYGEGHIGVDNTVTLKFQVLQDFGHISSLNYLIKTT